MSLAEPLVSKLCNHREGHLDEAALVRAQQDGPPGQGSHHWVHTM